MSKKILLLASKPLGLLACKQLYQCRTSDQLVVITFTDQHDPRSCFANFQQFTKDHGIELIVVANQQETNERITALQPDLCFVVGWYWLIPESVLNLVPMGFIGLHNSLLPKYRGGSPLVWTLINGDAYAGFSFFALTAGVDDGPIWAQAKVAIGESDTIADCLDKLAEKSINLLADIYPQIISGQLQPQPQNHEQASYCALRRAEDGLINWHWPATRMINFIKAQSQPYPGAFTEIDGKQVIIWQAQPFPYPYYSVPGQVLLIEGDRVTIGCGDDTAIVVDQVETNGQLLPASDIFKSIKQRL
ncbi:methionyl-tRNA formyltransferase [Endozoicomonas sp. SM1973]|uniref:Methionyl-tRNA formyltransferase n=1 Tax=Spartinivicinus marinus TaxID=2994442 RepID=A0A853I4H5_9GAMM|nr:methionyl-tRNA formyltransferase [Spartinivicinus marinus]MCX4029895.1 methionyl-tRNA formyltransferase [Spartinivicinus marinus]NYZ64861.1 methionyl-tRNA formyltransferase [Spartinivicinus marinus]